MRHERGREDSGGAGGQPQEWPTPLPPPGKEKDTLPGEPEQISLSSGSGCPLSSSPLLPSPITHTCTHREPTRLQTPSSKTTVTANEICQSQAAYTRSLGIECKNRFGGRKEMNTATSNAQREIRIPMHVGSVAKKQQDIFTIGGRGAHSQEL